ncbi:MAG: hypothetical protein KGO96_13160 [Elusimicrobia bacterium]|nr:hypothetical protein [Elusimicrobiota bacterium]
MEVSVPDRLLWKALRLVACVIGAALVWSPFLVMDVGPLSVVIEWSAAAGFLASIPLLYRFVSCFSVVRRPS